MQEEFHYLSSDRVFTFSMESRQNASYTRPQFELHALHDAIIAAQATLFRSDAQP